MSFVSHDATQSHRDSYVSHLGQPISFIQANLTSPILTQTPLPAWPYLHVLSQTLARSASTLPSHKEDGLIFHWTHSVILCSATKQGKAWRVHLQKLLDLTLMPLAAR